MSALRVRTWAHLLFAGVLLVGCRPSDDGAEGLRTELVVATRNAPATYYIDRDGQPAGFEYDLAHAFAESQGWNLTLVVRKEIGGIFDAVVADEVDFAAAGLTKTAERLDVYRAGPTYQEVEERVVCGRRSGVKEPEDLAEARIRVVEDSSYIASLQALREQIPGLSWRTSRAESAEQLLEKVHEGDLQCTVVDSTILALGRRLLPGLRSPFAIGESVELGWFLSKRGADLLPRMEAWFAEMVESKRLEALRRKYYSGETPFSAYDRLQFLEHIETRLPAYEPLFRTAAEETGMDWVLLAAVGYQESHWDPEAVSPTGVRGLMMLTEAAARDLEIADRLDSAQSISGGARYLRRQLGGVPIFIREPDRTSMALAAYNVGLGHLIDARSLAVRLGHNPNTWAGVSSVLPLLSQQRYYEELKYGYARGGEPVVYVRRVRKYYDLLQEEIAKRPPEPEAIDGGEDGESGDGDSAVGESSEVAEAFTAEGPSPAVHR